MKTTSEIASARSLAAEDLPNDSDLPTLELTSINMPAPTESRKLVWVVDDDETVLMLAEAVLASEGFAVRTFSEPERAIEAATHGHPDIIVLDVMMPGMNGFEFCSRLRMQPDGVDVPVLMATSLDDPSSIARAYEAGATNFATKPLNWAIETHRLRYMLRVAETSRLLKSKEQETRLAKEDWERTFNSFSDIVTLLSPDLKVLRANLATVTALKKPLDSIIGFHCYQLFTNSEVPCTNCPIQQAILTGTPVSAEKHYCHSAAGCLLTGSPVTDKNGRLLHVVHIARDLTEQKQLEAEYRQAQKMEAMGTLAGGIAHDFNNLLMVVSGCAELARQDPLVTGEQREFADTVYDAAQRGAALSRQLLTFSRKGVAKNEKRPLRFNDVIRDLQKMIQRIFPKNIAIHTQFDANLHVINGSADTLNQVMMNLAVNASHAMPNGGTLAIETRNVLLDASYCRLHPEIQPGEFVLVAVADTGHGMDAQTLQRIYEPFFTTKKIGEGTGLGLSVVYGIIKDHGGHIKCESQVGVGTTFKLYFPVQNSTADSTLVQTEAGADHHTGSETILIVDDEASIRTVVQRAFIKLGYEVISACDGESALLRYSGEEGNDVHLAVLDIGMPGMGGWECLKQLRAINPKLPVLLTTGYGGQELLERARQEGAAGLITKPYQLEQLHRSVRDILDGVNLAAVLSGRRRSGAEIIK